MNVFQYRAMCAQRVEDAKKAIEEANQIIVNEGAKVAVIDEMIELGVISEKNDVADEVEETEEVVDQPTTTVVDGIY